MSSICCRIADLGCKEVVNICDGARLGYVEDVEVDTCSGRLCALIVPVRDSLMGMFSKGEEYIIPWEAIEKIGDDIILVNYDIPSMYRRHPKTRGGFFRK